MDIKTILKKYLVFVIGLYFLAAGIVLIIHSALGTTPISSVNYVLSLNSPPTEIVDATGCGDTYMAGYLYMRNKGASYKEAGCFAAAMCTIKLEASGPFGGTEKDVWDIIERYK